MPWPEANTAPLPTSAATRLPARLASLYGFRVEFLVQSPEALRSPTLNLPENPPEAPEPGCMGEKSYHKQGTLLGRRV